MRRALILFALLAACHPPAPAHPEDAPLDVARLADAIDPGELPPLTAGMPPWLVAALAGTSNAARDPATLADALGTAIRSIARDGQLSQPTLIDLLNGIYALGQVESDGACALACLAASEKGYGALDVPMLGDPDGFFSELIDVGLQAMEAQGGDPAQLREVIDYVRAVIRAAPAHQRHVAARVLRLAPDSPEATQVLRDLSGALGRAGDTGRALQLARAVAARAAPASFDDVHAVTRACLHHLRLDCAIAWHARAAELATEPAQHTTVDDEAADLIRVRRVLAIGDAPGLDLALERAHLLIELDLSDRATVELEALRAAHPEDARPVIGLVRASFDRLRASAAAKLLAEARLLAHHDQAFYELALGMFFTRFMGELLPQVLADPDSLPALLATVLPQLGDDVAGFATYAPGRAAVLAVVVDKARAFLPLLALPSAEQHARFAELARAALAETRALRVRFPDEIDAHRLALVLSRFGGSNRGDYGVVDDPLPATGPDGDEVAIMRASLLLSLLVAWEDASHLPALHAAIDAMVATPATQARVDDLHADAIALDAAIGGDDAAWARAEAAYRARLAVAAKEDRGRLRNNLGVTLWHRGAKDEAAAAWGQATVDGDPVSVARLNLHATEPVTAETLAALADVGAQGERAASRYQALRWYAARAGLAGAELADARAKADAALAESGFGMTVSGARGVILDESFSFGLGYSSTKGLVTNFALSSSTWLVVPAP